MRRVGIEEELLLVDSGTGELRPLADEVVDACNARGAPDAGARIKPEFFSSQVEVSSSALADLGAARGELADARARVAEAAARWGAAPVAVPGPLLEVGAEVAAQFSPGERYASIRQHYGELAHQSLMCALHVHVEIYDEHEGVAAIDRLRSWVPVLMAMSGNSPFWRGVDTGYDSWRSLVLNSWPTSGPVEPFGSAGAYHEFVGSMMRTGAAVDVSLVNLDVRLSPRYPTLEFRFADVSTELDDTLVFAALARALVTHAVDQWRTGSPVDQWRLDQLRAAAWSAARFGLSATMVSPDTREETDARALVDRLLARLEGPLAAAGDTDRVLRGVATLDQRGTGAARQRAAFEVNHDLADVVADVRARTIST